MDFQFSAAVEEKRDEETGEIEPIPFTLNVTEMDDDGVPLEEQRFEQDDHEYLCKVPSPELLSMIVSDSNSGNMVPMMSTVWVFFENTMSAEDYRHLRLRVLDKEHTGIDYSHLLQVMQQLIKTFTGFPTKPSADSSRSPKATGQRSTGRRPGPGSTRSSSARVAG